MYVHNIRQLSNPGQVQTAEKEMRVWKRGERHVSTLDRRGDAGCVNAPEWGEETDCVFAVKSKLPIFLFFYFFVMVKSYFCNIWWKGGEGEMVGDRGIVTEEEGMLFKQSLGLVQILQLMRAGGGCGGSGGAFGSKFLSTLLS